MDRPPRPDFDWRRLNSAELPLEELQRLDDAASRGTDEQGGAAGDAVAQPGMGLEITPPPLRSVWGVVTGAYTLENEPSPAPPLPLYEFKQVYHDQNKWHLVEGGVSGVALEVSGNLDVGGGVPYVFWPSEDAVRTQSGPEPAGASGEKWRFVTPPNPKHVTVGSGSGGCDVLIDGAGTVCIEENVTIINDGTTIINNLFVLGSWFDVSFVTSVCPVFASTLKIDGVTRTVDPPVVVGFSVERRVMRVPLGTVLSDPYCESDPDSCCEELGGSGSGSGSGTGGGPDNSCCSPMPPPVLWATIGDRASSGPCDCLPVCVELDYDAARDGWYSAVPTFVDCAGGGATGCFRLRCRAGLWYWAVVDAADDVLIEGVIRRVVCDPFYCVAWFHDDVTDELCGQLFSYVITEVDCSGAAPGDCCAGDTPRTWAVTLAGLTGDCAGYNGAWTLTQDALRPCLWQGTALAPDDLHFAIVDGQAVFSFDAGGGGGRTAYQGDFAGDCCSPLTLPLDTNNCDAGVPAAVTLTPSCGGGTISSPCCPDDLLSETLYATFTGALAALGTVALHYTLVGEIWSGPAPGGTCLGGEPHIGLSCLFGGTEFNLSCGGLDGAFVVSGPPASCDPFLLTLSGTATGACAGPFGVTVRATP